MNPNVKIHQVNYPEKIRKGVLYYAGLDTPTELHKDVRNAILYGKTGLNGYIGVALGFEGQLKQEQRAQLDNTRRLVLAWLFTAPDEIFVPLSSAGLTPQQVNGVSHWINEQLENGGRRMRLTLIDELQWIIARANEDLKRTVEAMKNGVDLTFGACLARWENESPFGGDDHQALDWWWLDDFAENYVTDEVIARWRESKRQQDATPSVSVENNHTVEDFMSEYF